MLVLGSIAVMIVGLLLVFVDSDAPKRVVKKDQQYDYSILTVPKTQVAQVGLEALQGQMAQMKASLSEKDKQINQLLQLYGQVNKVAIPPADKATGLKVPLPGINSSGLMTGEVSDSTVKTPIDKLLENQQKDFERNQQRDDNSRVATLPKQPVREGSAQKSTKILGESKSVSSPSQPEEVKPTFQIRMLQSNVNAGTAGTLANNGLVKASLNSSESNATPPAIKGGTDAPPIDNGSDSLFLPAGSIISGVLITGMDAPTSPQARKEPFPALIRIKHEAILPNNFRLNLSECFLIAGGMGDMSSERVMMRSEVLSCTTKDGGVVEASLDSYAVGDDGKAGMRARLVSRNGQLIAKSLVAGFMEGIASAFKPQQVPSVNLNSTGTMTYQTPSSEYVIGRGTAEGAYTAAGKIADYWMSLAKDITPVLELDAGRQVDFIVKKGVSLRLNSNNHVSNTASISNIVNSLKGSFQ